jgi:ribosome-binding factor A
MSRRTERVASTIQHELAQIMMRELTDPRLAEHMISITRVKVSPDISIADVYVTVMGTPGQQTAALNALKHSAGLMRTKLTKQLALRVAPFLKFHIDENLKKELAVLDLIDKAAKETAELDRQRAAEQAPGCSAPPPPPADQTSPHDQNPKAE